MARAQWMYALLLLLALSEAENQTEETTTVLSDAAEAQDIIMPVPRAVPENTSQVPAENEDSSAHDQDEEGLSDADVPKSTTINVKEMLTYKSSEEATVENGGHRISMPGQKNHSPRHVRAHDGFHNIEHEPAWAHWNDAFTPTHNVENGTK